VLKYPESTPSRSGSPSVTSASSVSVRTPSIASASSISRCLSGSVCFIVRIHLELQGVHIALARDESFWDVLGEKIGNFLVGLKQRLGKHLSEIRVFVVVE
jgi:hypothetical protein